MEWQIILVLGLVILLILFPAASVWYLNVGSIYVAAKEARERKAGRKEAKTEYLAFIGRRVKPAVLAMGRLIRIVLPIAIGVGVYASLIWFFLGHFGWQVALIVGLMVPIMLIAPVLAWAVVVSGLYLVARDALRRRAIAPRRRAAGTAEEPVLQKVT